MFFPIPAQVRRQAKSPHELAMVNLLLFNLPLLIALLGGSFLEPDSSLVPYRPLGVAVPLALSLAVIGYSLLRARQTAAAGPWFAALHWRLAVRRHLALLGVYLAGGGLIGLAWLLAHSQKQPAMQEMLFIALQRVAVAPLLIALMVLVMLASGALYQAGRGEVPDRLVARFPPPPGLTGTETEFPATE